MPVQRRAGHVRPEEDLPIVVNAGEVFDELRKSLAGSCGVAVVHAVRLGEVIAVLGVHHVQLGRVAAPLVALDLLGGHVVGARFLHAQSGVGRDADAVFLGRVEVPKFFPRRSGEGRHLLFRHGVPQDDRSAEEVVVAEECAAVEIHHVGVGLRSRNCS